VKINLIDKNGSCIPVLKENLFIGRSDDNDIVVKGNFISRRHCRIFRKENTFYIEDLKSRTGVFVNGCKINNKELKTGDEISFNNLNPYFTLKIDTWPFLIQLLAGKSIIISLIVTIALLLSASLVFGNRLKDTVKRQGIKSILKDVLSDYSDTTVPDDARLLQKVSDYIEYESRDQNGLDRLMKRAEYYWPRAKKTFASYNVPEEYLFIAFVESNFNPNLKNRSGAAGMWQVMPETGRDYGLKVSGKDDERYDPEKSAHVTAKYIQDMIGIFGAESYNIILASYNAGDGRIRYGLKKIEDPATNRNFWYLYEHDLIPDETKQYVIKVFAYIVLAKEYGLIE
jgi:hypothetical protein